MNPPDISVTFSGGPFSGRTLSVHPDRDAIYYEDVTHPAGRAVYQRDAQGVFNYSESLTRMWNEQVDAYRAVSDLWDARSHAD